MIDLLQDTACLPSYAKKYLAIMIESNEDLIKFIEEYLYQYSNCMMAIAEFRSYKMKNRNYSFEQFQKDFERYERRAIEKLFLYPHSRTVERSMMYPLFEKKFTLKQVFDFHQKNKLINSILAGKSLSQLP